VIQDVFVVGASAHSYNLAEDNYAAGRYSRAVVDAFHGAHYGLSPVGHRPHGMLTRFTGTPENKARLVVGVPLARLGLSEEVAEGIVYIASDEASFVTGHHPQGGRWSQRQLIFVREIELSDAVTVCNAI
jgi:NAD(P)-dependent dehydrogenase (short-subunit alcohol dehydrogenase family)